MGLSAPHRQRRHQLFVLALIFVLLAAGILAGGYFGFERYEQSFEIGVDHQLLAIVDSKVDQLLQWRNEQLEDGKTFFNNSSFRTLVCRYLKDQNNPDARHSLSTWLSQLQAAHSYDKVTILDARLSERMSFSQSTESTMPVMSEETIRILMAGEIDFQDFYFDEHEQKNYVRMLIPIFSVQSGGNLAGVLSVRIDPQRLLFPTLNKWPVPSISGEFVLVRRDASDAFFLSDLRHGTDSAHGLHLPGNRKLVQGALASMTRTGIMQGVDYRGVPVIAAVRVIPGSPWALVAKVDIAEALEPLRGRLWLLIGLICALLVVAGSCVGWIWSLQMGRLDRKQLEIAELLRVKDWAIESAPNAIVTSDMKANLNYVNPAFLKLWGYGSDAEVVGRSISEFWKPGEKGLEVIDAVVTQGAWTGELVARRKDGVLFDADAALSVVANDEGTPVCLQASFTDVTERKKLERERQLEDRRLHMQLALHRLMDAPPTQLFEFMLEAITEATGSQYSFVCTLDNAEAAMTIYNWPNAAEGDRAFTDGPMRFSVEEAGLLGECVMQRRSIIMNDFLDTSSSKGLPLGRIPINRILAAPVFDRGKIVVVVAAANKENPYVESDCKTLVVLTNRFWGILRRKQAEHALQLSEQKYHRIASSMTDHLYTVKIVENRIVEIVHNPTCISITGYSEDELSADPDLWVNLVPEEDRGLVLNQVEQVLSNPSSPVTIEHRIIRKDGTVRWVSSTPVPHRNAKGDLLSYDGVLTDITERKVAEKAIEASRNQLRQLTARLVQVREEERTSIAREIHDELGQDLTGLKMNISWLTKKLHNDVKLQEKVLHMRQLVDTTIQAVRRIATELRPGMLDELGLPAAMEWHAKQFSETSGIACSIDINTKIATIPRHLSTTVFRIFQESLTNVARHSGATAVKAKLAVDESSLCLEVADNGCGATPSQLSDPQSVGVLGMKERALSLGGEVVFSAVSGSGTTVLATIPLENK